MPWLHDVSLSALAAAVLVLGVVMLLELHSIAQLRRAVEGSLARVFEQLDLLRFENQQILESQQSGAAHADKTLPQSDTRAQEAPSVPRASASSTLAAPRPALPLMSSGASAPARIGDVYQSAATLAASGLAAREIADRCGLATGEARLLSALAQARDRRRSAEAQRA